MRVVEKAMAVCQRCGDATDEDYAFCEGCAPKVHVHPVVLHVPEEKKLYATNLALAHWEIERPSDEQIRRSNEARRRAELN